MKELLLKLENGMRVCLLPNSEVGSVAVYLKGLAGSNYETLDNIGTAHLLEHLVLKGSKNFVNERNLLKLVTEEGGKFIGVTSRDDVLFGTHTLRDCLEKSLIFLSEIFYRPLLREGDILEVKSLIETEINRCFDNPEKLISRLAHASLFPNTRLAKFNIGNTNNIKNININGVRDFYKEFYTNNRFALVISGSFDVDNTVKLLNRYFSEQTGLSASDISIEISNKPITKIYDKYNFSQDYIRLDFNGFKTNDDQKYPAQILAKYLSTVIKTIFQKNGLAYKTDVNSYSGHHYGIFSFFATCTPKKLYEVIETFKTAVQIPIDKYLVESSKKSIIANLLFALEKPSMRAEYYSDLLLHGRTEQNATYEIDQIKKVNVDIVLKTVKEIFSQNQKITLISGENSFVKIDKFLHNALY